MTAREGTPPARTARRGTTAARVALLVAACAAALAGAAAGARHERLAARWRAWRGTGTIATEAHALAVHKLRLPLGGRDGALAATPHGVLVAGRDGALWFLDSARGVHPLTLAVPVEAAAFRAHPANAGLDGVEQFGVKGLLVQPLGGGRVRLLASHSRFVPDSLCYHLRVSFVELDARALEGAAAAPTEPHWRRAFDSWPCLPIGRRPDGARIRPTIGAGGRLAAVSPDRVVLTLGAFKGETRTDPPDEYWSEATAYGKTWEIVPDSGTHRLLTRGHRNPQGIALDPDGRLWVTEHGARGGDELNLVRDGANYGFPLVSYGTAYDAATWPSNPRQGRHDGFERPRFAWVPSVGVSQLLAVRGDAFPAWRGDLLVGTLATQELQRLRLDGDRVAYVERIPLSHRVRDLVEAPGGAIVVKTDDDRIIFLTNARR